MGLPDNRVDALLLTGADVEALATYLDVRGFLGEDTALAVSRVVGAAPVTPYTLSAG
ncbi:MAG: hypothetical protein JWP14_2647 [Frankiales bacterium]|nr:hypothetical protein [Frankiales bacterium]